MVCSIDQIELHLRIMGSNLQDKLKVHMYAVSLALRFFVCSLSPHHELRPVSHNLLDWPGGPSSHDPLTGKDYSETCVSGDACLVGWC